MTTVAILAPVDLAATPEQRHRAQRAAMQQMMLIARGHAVDSLEVRCAAELVGSALASSPLEFELAPTSEEAAAPTADPEPNEGTAQRESKDSRWKRSASYQSYMRTIMSQAA